MMQRPSDELLVAYLDGELDEAQFVEVGDWLDRDSSLRTRLTSLSESTALIREAFEPVLREPVPERLFAATHTKDESNVVAFQPKGGKARILGNTKRQWLSMAIAASLSCFVFGAGVSYVATEGQQPRAGGPLDNLPVYHISMSSANATVKPDFTPEDESKLPSDVILPDLKPWGLVFVGGRRIASEGKPAFQFFYTTENKDLGKVSLFVTSTPEPDVDPTYAVRDGVNMLYWRHRGHGYYIVGNANKGWMWSLKNDIAYQLKAM